MSNKLYNMFGEIEDIDSIENFAATQEEHNNRVINKYVEWTPRNDHEKLAVQRLRFYKRSENQVLSDEDKKILSPLKLTLKEGQLGKEGQFGFDYVSKLKDNNIDIAHDYFAKKAGFNLDEILKIKGQVPHAIVARINGISKNAVVDYVKKNINIKDVINKKVGNINVRKSDGLKLKGNLQMDGEIRATGFYLADGTRLTEIPKLALPSNVYHKDSKIGINVQNPESSLDIKGNLDVDEEITSNDVIAKKVKSNEIISKSGWLENINSSNISVKNPKNNNNPTGWGSYLNYKNKAENYIRGKTELRGETNFVGPARINISNPKNNNNPTGWGTHFNWQNKAENYIRGKTEFRGETNFVGPSRINIQNNKNNNNPTGWGTHFNYKNSGENYIRGKTELRGEVNFVDKNKEVKIHQNKNNNNPKGSATIFNRGGKSENYISGKTYLVGEVNLSNRDKGLNIINKRNGNNPTGGATHFNFKGQGKNFIRGSTEINGARVNIKSNNGLTLENQGKISTFGSTKSGWCHITTTAKGFKMDKSLVVKGSILANRFCLRDGKKIVCLDANAVKGILRSTKKSTRKRVPVIYAKLGNSNSRDGLHRAILNNNVRRILDKAKTYEIFSTVKVTRNRGGWRNVYRYGNNNYERLPALWIYPRNPWRFHFRVGTTNNWNNGFDFDIPRHLRRYNTDWKIRTKVTESGEKTLIQHWVNDQYVGGNWINGKLKKVPNRTFYIKDPWHDKYHYHVKDVVVKARGHGL